MLPSDKQENHLYRELLARRPKPTYLPSHVVTKRVRMSALTLSKIASSLMINTGGDSKINAGLNLKFEAKSQKVLGYTRKTDSGWEYSEKAIELIREYKVRWLGRCAIA
jgi:5'-3' exoribonuclease 1